MGLFETFGEAMRPAIADHPIPKIEDIIEDVMTLNKCLIKDKGILLSGYKEMLNKLDQCENLNRQELRTFIIDIINQLNS